ncbi:hypothetical protein [Loigolactobacillus jiayinensis]|uniref:Uncharacterized protein n=1 Tax=Loigolactobacillus jiayinensis TaxID=2486016 RepID=A0ABW1RD12_9LACO|nr:hypothetical protein [Loigolactobacillus jiayinensis]
MTWQDFLQAKFDLADIDTKQVMIEVPNTKEKLVLKINTDVLAKLKADNGKLQQLVKHLLRKHNKQTSAETIVINKRNLRIFL